MLLRVHNILEGDAAEHNLELDGEMDLTTLKVLLEDETKIPMDEQIFVSKGIVLESNDNTLVANGFRHNDSLIVFRRGSRISQHMRYQIELDSVKTNPYYLSQLQQSNPELATAVKKTDVVLYAAIVRSIETAQRLEEDERKDLFRRVKENPNDEDAQRQIAEITRMEDIQQNLMTAMEHHPEAFGQVHMLYINCEVNKTPVKAFVDSGAQMTIMSPSCAERCNIMRLVDERWSGIAQGVGTAKIIGRIHMVDINIGGNFLPCSISVIENQGVDMLLGLDMLKRHQCCIDLGSNVLRVGTTNASTPFLSESELPESARLHKHTSTDNTGSAAQADMMDAEQQSQTFDTTVIENLMAMGFARDQVMGALNACNGNADLAVEVLMGS